MSEKAADVQKNLEKNLTTSMQNVKSHYFKGKTVSKKLWKPLLFWPSVLKKASSLNEAGS